MPRVGPGRPASAAPGLLPRVQGIGSSIDDIRLRGEKLIDQVGDALLDGTLVRTMGGASTLDIDIQDTGRKVLNSSLLEDPFYDLTLDGLGFRYVTYESPGLDDVLTLNHEALVVARLRELFGPHKAFRDEVTRAEFLRQRVMELPPKQRPRFVSPELHKEQPIRNERESRQAADDAKQRRAKGIGEASLTVKGEKATSAQVAAGDRALRVAEGEGAETRVMIAMMESLIVESLIGKVASNWMQIEPKSVSGFSGNPNSLEESVRGFLLGYNAGHEGAIEYFRKHPGAKAHEIAQAVQRSGAGLPSNGAANYGPWADEAAEWVSAYGGGTDSTITETLRYPFEQKEDEDVWALGRKLAQPVNWRWFESAGWVYFLAELNLFKSAVRMRISDSTPGVLNLSVKGGRGKKQETATMEIMASSMAAPPGSVVQLRSCGPANGAWLVNRIESPLAVRESVCQVELKRPTKAKAEPAPPTRTRTINAGGVGGATTDDLGQVQIPKSSPGSPYWSGTAAIFKQFVHPFMQEYGISPGAEKEEGHTNGSDHALYSTSAYATDYPTYEGGEAANALGRAMGRDGDSTGTYERFEIEVDGMRFSVQILWHVPDHYDHVHVGIQRI